MDMLRDHQLQLALGDIARQIGTFVNDDGSIKTDRAVLARFTTLVFSAALSAIGAYVRMTPTIWDDTVYNIIQGPLTMARTWLEDVIAGDSA